MSVRVIGILTLAIALSFGFSFGKKQETKKTDGFSQPSNDLGVPNPDANLSRQQVFDVIQEDFEDTSSEEDRRETVLPSASTPALRPVTSGGGGTGGGMSMMRQLQVIKIQKQISEIIKANERIKQVRQAQIAQLEQVTNQAKIHRRLLDEIENQETEPKDLRSEDIDEILRQEKMRLIEEETQQNLAVVDSYAQETELSEPALSDSQSNSAH